MIGVKETDPAEVRQRTDNKDIPAHGAAEQPFRIHITHIADTINHKRNHKYTQ